MLEGREVRTAKKTKKKRVAPKGPNSTKIKQGEKTF